MQRPPEKTAIPLEAKNAICVALVLCVCACGSSLTPSDTVDGQAEQASSDEVWQPSSVCDPDDPHVLGPACVVAIPDNAAFDAVSIGPTGIQHWERATKYMVPVQSGPDTIPPLVQNANRYPVHMEFLVEMFFPGLTLASYGDLVTKRATRQYYTGNLIRINDPDLGVVYGFTIYTQAKMSEQLEPVEVKQVYDQLSALVEAGPLVYTFEPFDALGPMKARAWIDPGFPILYPSGDDVDVEVYTPGVTYGYLKLFDLDGFETAVSDGLIGFRDIVVVDAVPFDIEIVVAGVVTGGRQWELSHVNVRMARRGTPNLFIRDPLSELSQWDGKLVRLEALNAPEDGTDSYEITLASEEEAESWWNLNRPHVDDLPPVDAGYRTLARVTQMDTSGKGIDLVTRFGGKTTNLARLYTITDEEYEVPAFGIPFAWFEDYMSITTIVDNRVSPPETVSLNEYVVRLQADPMMDGDLVYRHDRLKELRDAIKAGHLSEAFVAKVLERIPEVFGDNLVPVRFRSSSNVEDGLEFSGAGLYDSTTVCAADSLDDNNSGPSLCNHNEPEERALDRGVLKVWASTYSDRAWAERDWYQIPQHEASMAILVSLAFPDEAANGVAFAGNPADPEDHRYLVNSQLGDEKVVSNDPSIVPELVRLDMDAGEVVFIDRVRSSSLAKPGVPVLDDPTLEELGALMFDVNAAYYIDVGTYDRDSILLDFEFKIEKGTGQIKLKQIRPFLMNDWE